MRVNIAPPPPRGAPMPDYVYSARFVETDRYIYSSRPVQFEITPSLPQISGLDQDEILSLSRHGKSGQVPFITHKKAYYPSKSISPRIISK